MSDGYDDLSTYDVPENELFAHNAMVARPSCGTCKWAMPSELPGWRKCVVPLPYWAPAALSHTLPADVEEDDTDCPTHEVAP